MSKSLDVFNQVCRDLPEGWQIDIELTEGCMGIVLTDPEGREVEMCDDDLSAEQMVIQRLNFARRSDGLQDSTDD